MWKKTHLFVWKTFELPFVLKQEEQPQCIARQIAYTLKHFLTLCGNSAHMKKMFFLHKQYKNLFKNVNMEGILSFLREIKLYQRL